MFIKWVSVQYTAVAVYCIAGFQFLQFTNITIRARIIDNISTKFPRIQTRPSQTHNC